MKVKETLLTATLATSALLIIGRVEAVEKRPNILFALADDISFPHMSVYGCKWVSTPAFDRVAKNGILFQNAYTPNAKSAPSRSCILTGRNSWQLEAAANHMCFFPADYKVVTEVLAENGYHVGYTGKGWVPGIAQNANGNNRELLIKAYRTNKLQAPTSEISNEDYARDFESFLTQKKGDQPFFFWYGGWEPHRAFEYGSGLRYGKRLSEIDKVLDFWPDVDSVRTDLLDYAYELEYFDKQLGKMLTLLEKTGQLDNTVIIVTADNGMAFPRIKGQAYERSNHLPLAIMWPKGIKNPGRTIRDFVSFIDFTPTFLELANIALDKTGMKQLTGKSLTSLFSSSKSGWIEPGRDYVLIGKERHDVGRPSNQGYPIRGIVTRDYLYIKNYETKRWPVGNPETGYLNCDGSPTKTVCIKTRNTVDSIYWRLNFGFRPSEELYDLKKDRDCMNNLATDKRHAAKKQKLIQLMVKELKLQNDPRMFGKGELFDNYPVAPLSYMFYYENYLNNKAEKVNWVNPGDYE
jgi:arylsulfatase A-like enzyme